MGTEIIVLLGLYFLIGFAAFGMLCAEEDDYATWGYLGIILLVGPIAGIMCGIGITIQIVGKSLRDFLNKQFPD